MQRTEFTPSLFPADHSIVNIALAIILHPTNGTLLIAQRKADAHLGDLWEFPGGKCLPAETPHDCAVRETREETGLEIVVLETWPVITHVYPDRTVILHPFLCRARTAEAQARESKQISWVLPKDLNHYPFPEANQPLLERLLPNPRGFTG